MLEFRQKFSMEIRRYSLDSGIKVRQWEICSDDSPSVLIIILSLKINQKFLALIRQHFINIGNDFCHKKFVNFLLTNIGR